MLGTISAQMLVLHGFGTKPYFTRGARHVADHVRGARLHEIRGAGHAVPLTHPAALATALSNFFRRCDGRLDAISIPAGA